MPRTRSCSRRVGPGLSLALVPVALVAALALPAGADTVAHRDERTATASAPKAKAKVKIKTFRFAPETVEVSPGTKVVFKNKDQIEHTVTSDDGAPVEFDETLPGKGEKATVTLSEPGTYEYFCSRHPSMRGTIVVG